MSRLERVEIVGDQVVPEGTFWAHWQIANLLHDARELRDHHGLAMRVLELEESLARAIPELNRTQGALLHNDPHPWNVLVDGNRGWRCSAWLDWEYAWVGDPVWDLVRMDLWRMWPLDTPEAFWDGYGTAPREPNRSVYEMSIYLWQALDELTGCASGPRHTRVRALEYTRTFTDSVDRLRSMVAP